MKLTPRLTLIFIAYASALLIGVGVMVYDSGRDALREATISELQATALEKDASLDRWVQDRQIDVSALASDPTTILAAYNLLNADSSSTEAQVAHDEMVANLLPHLKQGDFLELILLIPSLARFLPRQIRRRRASIRRIGLTL